MSPTSGDAKPEVDGPLFASIMRHNRSVSLIKRILIIVALLLTGMLILWPIINPVEKHLKLSFGKITVGEAGKPQMLHPKFQGVDENGQPYKIYADVAIQEEGKKVQLQTISGNIELNNHKWVTFKADSGNLELENDVGYLTGSVHVESSDHYHLRTETVKINFKKGKAIGHEIVIIEGPKGSLEATGFVADNKAGIITFSGPVKAVIQPTALEKGVE